MPFLKAGFFLGWGNYFLEKMVMSVGQHPTLGYIESTLNLNLPNGTQAKLVRELAFEN